MHPEKFITSGKQVALSSIAGRWLESGRPAMKSTSSGLIATVLTLIFVDNLSTWHLITLLLKLKFRVTCTSSLCHFSSAKDCCVAIVPTIHVEGDLQLLTKRQLQM